MTQEPEQGQAQAPQAPQQRPERRTDSTLEEFASTALRSRWGGRVKVVKHATLHLALELSSDEVSDLRMWLDDHQQAQVAGSTEVRYTEGQGVPLPDVLVRMLLAVTD